MTKPRIAIVCDWLAGVGGAEKVILAVHRMYPEAPIYTSQYRPKKIDWFDDADVRTGWLNALPIVLKRFIPFLRQFYFDRLDLSDYDVVISITGAEAKAVKTNSNTTHISYMHAPTQYYWTLYDQYIENPGFGFLNPVARLGLKLLVGPLRKADYKSAQKPDIVVANSSYIQAEIEKYYDRDSVVIWPNVNVEAIQKISNQKLRQRVNEPREGYIIYGRQVSWKRMDVAIRAAMMARRHLTVIGYGPEENELRRIADESKYITFLPRYNGLEEIVDHIVSAKAFLFPSIEPFGIAPVEALAAGTPVIGLNKGGAVDMIEEGVNGVFFDEQTAGSLAAAIDKFEKIKFDTKKVQSSANKFSENNFKKQLAKLVDENVQK